MIGILAYFGTGLVVFVLIFRLMGRNLLPKAKVDLPGLFDPVAILLWPIGAFLLIIEFWHLRSKKKWADEREAARKSETKYSRMSMEELLAEQKRTLESLKPREE